MNNLLEKHLERELPQEVKREEAGYAITFQKINGNQYSFWLDKVHPTESKDNLPKKVKSILGRRKISYLGIDFYTKIIGKAILLVQSSEWTMIESALANNHENRNKLQKYCKKIGNKFSFTVTEVVGGVSSSITIKETSYSRTSLNQKVGKALLIQELVEKFNL